MSSDLFSPLSPPAGDPFGSQPGNRTLGIVALVISVVIVAAATTTVALAGDPIGSGAGRALAEAPVGQGVDPTWLASLQVWVMVAEAAFVFGTIGGMWVLIQAIIAIATNRGRLAGVVAAVVAAAGPALFIAAGTITMFAGYAGAASMPVG